MKRTAFLVGLALFAFGAQAREIAIAAYRLGCVDLGASTAFYETHFGFTVFDKDETLVVMTDPAGAYLVLTPASAPVSIEPGAAFVRLNFAVADLDAARESMEQGGVTFLAEERSAVGRYATFVDPSGHHHNLKQLDAGGVTETRIYNAGIGVVDMEPARELYERTLGFEAIDGYYPPVVPMKPVGGRQFVLSDRGVDSAAAYDYGTGAFAGIAFAGGALEPAIKELEQEGVEFLFTEPRISGPVRFVAFRDASGNIHELIEHITPGTGSERD